MKTVKITPLRRIFSFNMNWGASWHTHTHAHNHFTALFPGPFGWASWHRLRYMIAIMAALQRPGRDHQGILVSHAWTPFSETWEPTTLRWTKQSIWFRTTFYVWHFALLVVHARKEEEDKMVVCVLCVVWSSTIYQSSHGMFPYLGQCAYGWWQRCQNDPNGFPTRDLKETTRASPYHVAEHHPMRPESLQPYTELVLLRYPKPTPKPRFFAKTVRRRNLGFSTVIDSF